MRERLGVVTRAHPGRRGRSLQRPAVRTRVHNLPSSRALPRVQGRQPLDANGRDTPPWKNVAPGIIGVPRTPAIVGVPRITVIVGVPRITADARCLLLRRAPLRRGRRERHPVDQAPRQVQRFPVAYRGTYGGPGGGGCFL